MQRLLRIFILPFLITLPGVVAAADYSVAVDADTYAPGEAIEVEWERSPDAESRRDWIGIFAVDAAASDYRDWSYLSDSSDAGTLTLSEDSGGMFEVRLLTNNGYSVAATSEPFAIEEFDDPDSDPVKEYRLTVSPIERTLGEAVSIEWQTPSDTVLRNDWIGLYSIGTADSSYNTWFYVDSETGSRQIELNQTGKFEFRYFKNNGYDRVAVSDPVVVTTATDPDPDPDPGGEYTLTLDANEIEVGQRIEVTYTTDTNDSLQNDWIGLYREGRSDRSYLKWKYIDKPTGTVSFPVNDTGTYDLRYFKNNGYDRVAVSDTFDVISDENPDDPPVGDEYLVRADRETYEIGDIANAVWETPAGANIIFDWIGLYRPGTSDRAFLDYEYTDSFSNREQFPLSSAGTFEFRYFKNNTYDRVATSPTFDVIDETTPGLCNGYDLDEITNYPSGSGPVVALGDSITFGVGASPGENYVEELQDRLGVSIVNAGVPADTTRDALARLDRDVLDEDPSTVIVFIGGNDELRRIYESLSDSAADRQLEDELDQFVTERLGLQWREVPLLNRNETFQNLETIVTEIQATGANTIVVGYDNTLYNDTIAENYERIANETGSIYIPDIYDDIFGRPSRMSDFIHPNDLGYDIIADRIQVGLECLI